jgi:hypothetical protein
MMRSILEGPLARALLRVSPLHRDLLRQLLGGGDAEGDEGLARRYGTTEEALRVERFIARQRLAEAIQDISQG